MTHRNRLLRLLERAQRQLARVRHTNGARRTVADALDEARDCRCRHSTTPADQYEQENRAAAERIRETR